jgi:glutamine synthetase
MYPFEDISFLGKINNLFENQWGIQVKIGFEQEFYCNIPIEELEINYPELYFENETGPNQFEAITKASFNLEKLCNDIIRLRSNPKVNFAAKPFNNQPSSALNLSVSLWRDNCNLFAKKIDGSESEYLTWAVSGLEDLANELIYFYCPSAGSYERIKEASDHVPTKICWGYNNRTSTFRIPTTDSALIRIENRIISADANPIAACNATLFSIFHGITNKLLVNHKIYGDSSHQQYQLIKLIDNFEEAKSRYYSYAAKVSSFLF